MWSFNRCNKPLYRILEILLYNNAFFRCHEIASQIAKIASLTRRGRKTIRSGSGASLTRDKLFLGHECVVLLFVIVFYLSESPLLYPRRFFDQLSSPLSRRWLFEISPRLRFSISLVYLRNSGGQTGKGVSGGTGRIRI